MIVINHLINIKTKLAMFFEYRGSQFERVTKYIILFK